MVKLFVLADDITGALDTGVKFAGSNIATLITTDMHYDFARNGDGAEVLVMSAQTRHLTAEQAYQIVYDIICRAAAAGIPYIYKKTDSALRGNIGSELAAVLKASGEMELSFLPAFPSMGRTTVAGLHYLNGRPIHESVFGGDLLNPVTCSYVPDIIATQSDVATQVVGADFEYLQQPTQPVIRIYDSATPQQLEAVAHKLHQQNRLKVMAGCAGFAEALPELLEFERVQPTPHDLGNKLLVVCGSVNPITLNQLEYAAQAGFRRIQLTPQQKVDHSYLETPEGKAFLDTLWELYQQQAPLIIDTNSEFTESELMQYAQQKGIKPQQISAHIADNLGRILKDLVLRGAEATLLVTGGDTLIAFISQIGCNTITPIVELEEGAVLSQLQYQSRTLQIISKSGGFGEKTLLANLAEQIYNKAEVSQK